MQGCIAKAPSSQASKTKDGSIQGQEKIAGSRSQSQDFQTTAEVGFFWEPCFFNWNLMRSLRGNVEEANKGARFAPHFHSDGRIPILQHGVKRYLPCPDKPPVLSPASELMVRSLYLSRHMKDGGGWTLPPRTVYTFRCSATSCISSIVAINVESSKCLVKY